MLVLSSWREGNNTSRDSRTNDGEMCTQLESVTPVLGRGGQLQSPPAVPRGREGAAAEKSTGQAAAAEMEEARGAAGHLGASSGAKSRGRKESFSYSSDFRTPLGCFRRSLRS